MTNLLSLQLGKSSILSLTFQCYLLGCDFSTKPKVSTIQNVALQMAETVQGKTR